jgi:hypothetical protein
MSISQTTSFRRLMSGTHSSALRVNGFGHASQGVGVPGFGRAASNPLLISVVLMAPIEELKPIPQIMGIGLDRVR